MIRIIDCGSSKVPFIEEAVDAMCDFETIPMFESTKKPFTHEIGVIISGAPILLTEVDNQPYLDAMTWIKDCPVPILGICFGHQIIGLLHGASVSRQKEDRDWQTIEQLVDDSLFSKLAQEFEMMEDHCESISIPQGFELIASSDACVNEGMKHKVKHIYGVQFHPEVSGSQGFLLIENFVDICLKQQAKTQ